MGKLNKSLLNLLTIQVKGSLKINGIDGIVLDKYFFVEKTCFGEGGGERRG